MDGYRFSSRPVFWVRFLFVWREANIALFAIMPQVGELYAGS